MYIVNSKSNGNTVISQCYKTRNGAENAKKKRELSGAWDSVEILEIKDGQNIVDSIF